MNEIDRIQQAIQRARAAQDLEAVAELEGLLTQARTQAALQAPAFNAQQGFKLEPMAQEDITRNRERYFANQAKERADIAASEQVGLTDIGRRGLSGTVEAAPSGVTGATQLGAGAYLGEARDTAQGMIRTDPGTVEGLTRTIQGVSNPFSTLVGMFTPEKAPEQLQQAGQANLEETLAIRKRNAEEIEKLKQAYVAEGGSEFAADVAAGVGGSLTSVAPLAGAAIVGGVTRSPAAAMIAQRTLAILPATQAYADSYAEYRAKYPDASEADAQKYAMSMASIEFGVESMIPGGAGGLAGTGLKQAAGAVASRTAREGLTEGVTEITSQVAQRELAPALAPQTPEDALYNVGLATTAGTVLGGPINTVGVATERAGLTRAQRVEQQRLAEAKQAEERLLAEIAARDRATAEGIAAQKAAEAQAQAAVDAAMPQSVRDNLLVPRGPVSTLEGRGGLSFLQAPDLGAPQGPSSTLLDASRIQEELAGPASPFLPRAEGVDLTTPRGENSTILQPTEANLGQPRGPVSVLPGQAPQAALGLDTPRGEATPLTEMSRLQARQQDQASQIEALTQERDTISAKETPLTRKERSRIKTLNKEIGRLAISQEATTRAINEEAARPQVAQDVSLGDLARTQLPRLPDPPAPQPATTVQPQPQTPPVEAPRPVSVEPTTQPTAAPVVREDVIDLETGKVTGEQTAEVGVPVNDTQRRQLEDFFNDVKANRSVNLPSDQQAAFARIMNVQVPPEQRKATPLRQALSRARTAWDALAGVKAAVRMGADPKIERYDRLIDSLTTEDMKNVGFTLLQPETEARTPFQRALKDDPKELQTKGSHEVDPATGRDEVTIVGDGYARRDGTATVETTLHEIVHAKTAAAIRAVREGRETDPAIVQAVRDLEAVRTTLKDSIPKSGLTADEKSAVSYAVSDTDEFVTGVMTNPLVQSALKKENLWDKVRNIIRALLRIPRSQKSLLDEVLDASYALTDALNKRDKRMMAEANPVQVTDQTKTPEFKRWFGDSVIVDSQGRPQVVYHGTRADFDTFRPSIGSYGRGIYLTPSGQFAGATYAEGDGGNVMPVYASMSAPYVIDVGDATPHALAVLAPQEMSDWLRKNGFDGVIVELNGEIQTIVALDSGQVKSAIGNQGTFDPNNPDIRRSVTAPKPTRSQRSQAGLPEARQPTPQELRGTIDFTSVQGWRNGLGVSKDLFGDLFTGLMTSTRGVGTEVKVAERLRDGAKQETDLIVEAFLNRVRSVIDKTNPSEESRKSINDRVMNYLRGNKAALDEVSGEVREVRAILGNKEFREAIDSARSEIDNLTKRIGQEIVRAYQGRPMPEAMTKKLQTLKNGLGIYMTRVYEAFIDRKYGADLLQKYEAGDETARDVLKPLLDRLTDQTAFLGENLDNAERVAKLENDALEAQGRKPTQKPWSSANWEKVSDIKLETMYRDLIGSAAGLPREQMFNELRQWFNDNVGNATDKKEASQKTAMRIVRDILLTNSTNTPMAQFWRKMRTDDRALKDLEDVPTDVRKALGEVKDPFLRAAFTMSRQTAVVASLAQNNTLMEYSPQLFKPQAERVQGVHDFRIPNNPLAYGKLAGMFTDKNTHDFIVGSTEIYGADSLTELADLATKFRSGEDYIGAVGAYVLRKGMALSQMQKFAGIVFNHGAAVLDYAGIPSFIIGRGNVDPGTLKSAVAVTKQLVGTQFRKKYSDETRRIMSLGIIDPALTRIDEQVDQAMRETELRQKLRKGTATYDVLKGFLTSTFNLIRDARAFAENIPKVANYLNNERFLRKAFPDLSQKEIERLAVEKTLRTEINYSMVPKMVRLTESLGVGYVVSFMWESYRTGFTNHIEAIREIRSGNPTMRQLGIQRLVGSTVGLAGMSYLYGTVLSGMVGALELDDEWDELMRYLGWHQQGQNRGILGIGNDLTVTSADFGRMDGMDVYSATWRSVAQMLGQFAEGDDEGAIETAKATAEATASAFVGGAPLGTLAINTAAGRESKNFFEKEFPGLYDNFKASAGEVFGDSAATNIVDFLAAVTAAYTPGSGKQILRGVAASNRDEGTPTVLALAAGMPVSKDNPLATLEGGPARAFINTRREASASMQDAVTIGTSKETPALIQSAVEDYISTQRDAYEELTKYASVARAAGRMVGKSEAELTKLIYESLKKNNGFPDEQADRLSKGLPFQPTMPSNQTTFLKSAIDRALGNQRQTTEVSRAAFAERRQQMEARKEQVLSLLEDRIKSYKPEQQ